MALGFTRARNERSSSSAVYHILHAAQPEAFRENRLKALRNLATDLRALNLGDEANQVEREVMALTDETL